MSRSEKYYGPDFNALEKQDPEIAAVVISELVRLTKVYGDVAGTSAAELGRVRDDVTKTAKEISSAMGVSFKETIGLAADIAATGKTGDELLGSIKETTRLAVLGEVDRQEAMKATLAIQSAFKQNTEELSQSINLSLLCVFRQVPVLHQVQCLAVLAYYQ